MTLEEAQEQALRSVDFDTIKTIHMALDIAYDEQKLTDEVKSVCKRVYEHLQSMKDVANCWLGDLCEMNVIGFKDGPLEVYIAFFRDQSIGSGEAVQGEELVEVVEEQEEEPLRIAVM